MALWHCCSGTALQSFAQQVKHNQKTYKEKLESNMKGKDEALKFMAVDHEEEES